MIGARAASCRFYCVSSWIGINTPDININRNVKIEWTGNMDLSGWFVMPGIQFLSNYLRSNDIQCAGIFCLPANLYLFTKTDTVIELVGRNLDDEIVIAAGIDTEANMIT